MGTQALDTKRFTSPAFKFFVVFMPRTFTVWVVGSPATSESQVQQNQLPRNTTRETPPQLLLQARTSKGFQRALQPRTAPFRHNLFKCCNHQTGVNPIAGKVAVQVSEALPVLGNVPARV